jgi:DNA-directed RNA polymerase subunit M/transcription elongation factor TFIIS
MRFCENCNNMLYVTIDKDKRLVHYCKSCGARVVETDVTKSFCIVDDVKINDYTKYSQFINPWLKYDPCLPRVHNIKCPNHDCGKPSDKDNEVIYIKYDASEMKFIYSCCHCDHFWTND